MAFRFLIPEMECAYLGFGWVGPEMIFLIVWREVVKSIRETLLYNAESVMLCCYSQVICVDEPAGHFVSRLVVGIDVEEEGCKNTSLW